MRNSSKLFVAVAAAGLVATAGTAFTATSTIDDAAINVGSVAQSVSGATFTNVVHTYTASTDTTTALSARTAQVLSTATGVVKVYLNNSPTSDVNCTVTQVDTTSPADGTPDVSDVACDITDTVNLTDVRFVVNG